MKPLYLLLESAAGYFLLQVEEWDQTGNNESIEAKILKPDVFNRMVKFCSFISFETAEKALENLCLINEGKASPLLLHFLEINLPAKKEECTLGVSDLVLGKSLAGVGFNILHNNDVLELLRVCREYYFKRISKYMDNADVSMKSFHVGLGHSYSRSKIKLDPRKQDKSIINSIAVIEAIDKNINLFCMRITEWYGWHFPELKNIVADPRQYCELVHLIGTKENFDFEKNEQKLLEIVKDEETVKKITRMARASVGQELADEDLKNIMNFSSEVLNLIKTKNRLANYLDDKLTLVAPNLKELLGNTLSARLISHAGSLVNLAKCPSSSIQILGSEKALFNSLKGNKKTPKFGILFNSSYITKTPAKLKGKMSRYLSNKSAMAARIDSFGEVPTNAYGIIFKKQLEHRIESMVKGVKLSKNIDYINEAEELLKGELKKVKKEKKRKRNAPNENGEEEGKEKRDEVEEPEGEKKRKKKKSKKKEEMDEVVETVEHEKEAKTSNKKLKEKKGRKKKKEKKEKGTVKHDEENDLKRHAEVKTNIEGTVAQKHGKNDHGDHAKSTEQKKGVRQQMETPKGKEKQKKDKKKNVKNKG